MRPPRPRWARALLAAARLWLAVAARVDRAGARIGWWDLAPQRTRVLVGLHLGAVWALLMAPARPAVSLAIGAAAGTAAALLLRAPGTESQPAAAQGPPDPRPGSLRSRKSTGER